MPGFAVSGADGVTSRPEPKLLQVNKLEITTDKKLLAAAGNPQIRLFEVQSNNNQPVLTYDGHSTNVTAVRGQTF
jgi:hypothetical protein